MQESEGARRIPLAPWSPPDDKECLARVREFYADFRTRRSVRDGAGHLPEGARRDRLLPLRNDRG